MPTLPFATQEQADARDAAFWEAARGAGWQPGNVTTRLYGVRVRPADPEEPTELPDGVDVAIVIGERSEHLDILVSGTHVTAEEAIAVAPLYPAWASGAVYTVDDIVSYASDLYVVRQAHTAQADWQPPNVLALYMVYRADADTTLAWIASESVKVGWHRTYGGAEYECIQAHVTQSDWLPSTSITLWQAVAPPVTAWVAGTYALNALVTHVGRTWKSLLAGNAYEPSKVGTWRDQTVPPMWVAPAGAVGLWQINDTATHAGFTWRCTSANNTYEPSVYGWTKV